MSGHSKWHSIKHKKAVKDAKRGKIFTKHIRSIQAAARFGGGDPENNASLRLAIQKAKADNMPWDTIERAIKRGTGSLPGQNFESITYEAYGPCGVAIMIDALTDNKNRTVAELRHLLSKHGGNMGESGCVAWLFENKGYIVIPKSAISEDELMEIIISAGAEDMNLEDDTYEIYTEPKDYEAVHSALTDAGIKITTAEITMIPKTTVKITDLSSAEKILKLMDVLQDHDDVQNVYSNFDIEESVMNEIAKESEN